jgi:hypothetical protein
MRRGTPNAKPLNRIIRARKRKHIKLRKVENGVHFGAAIGDVFTGFID